MVDIVRTPRIRILLWTRRTRNMVQSRLRDLLPPEHEHQLTSLESILDELAKNALKANHKFLLIRNRMYVLMHRENESPDRTWGMVNEICNSTTNYNAFLRDHKELLTGLTEELTRILRQEAIWIDIRNKKYEHGRSISDRDRELLKKTPEFLAIFNDVKRRRSYVEFKGSRAGNSLWIEIINNAPMLQSDMDRIEIKRKQFKAHRDAGTEYDFFLNEMDTSGGGAGLGYATIDSHIAGLGIEPLDSLQIISLHSTNILVNLDLNKLRKDG